MQLIDRTPESLRSPARPLWLAVCLVACGLLSQCTSVPKGDVVVSVKDQKLGIYNAAGKLAKQYVISTSKFGLGDQSGSNRTPLGKHEVVAKIGKGLPAGAVLKSRRWNGEVLKPNAPGRDPIVSRILWLKGMESSNRNAFHRFIYIHGTPEENRLGTPASYGCVRMGMKDVVDLFNIVDVGAKVVITKDHLPTGTPESTAAAAPSLADDGSPSLGAPDSQAIEVGRLEPTDGERKRAVENEAKTSTKSKSSAPPRAPATKAKSKSKSKSKSDTKVAGHAPTKAKAKA